ncbi:MAG TPA: sphingomyelin phosphodiesterase [Bacteroidia bacterium]|nr:sphingomyelin phosphodiesterase [Bacteroidia bacterium]
MKTNKKNGLLNDVKIHLAASLSIILIMLAPLSGFSQCENQSQGGSIKILTWNIQMLPHRCVHIGQFKRAKEIVEVLKNQEADIIVFEEAFDKKSRNIIREGLKAVFPYESGDPGKNKFYKISSGVWILSKVQINIVKQIFFNESKGSDRLACKGAILVEGQKNGFCFQLVGTHLQSDLDNGKNVQPIRNVQYAQIRTELLERYAEDGVPQFVAGDFNTIQADSGSYTRLVSTLKLTQCPLEGDRCFSYDYGNNDEIVGPQGPPQLIDYVFYSNKENASLVGKMHIMVFRKQWDSTHIDLSDHFALAAEFQF